MMEMYKMMKKMAKKKKLRELWRKMNELGLNALFRLH